ncbi:DNA-protecting protein DprA [Paenibacillus sp. Marseille-P2973]|uniref:DNA-protecting protein DprA n=1 Tax=Paenibacillus sp. Marseille-P2973 TaxID=1871032 RepID=UPI0032B5A47C
MNLNDQELREFFEKEVLFTNEATKLLGISSQRLNQLVQSGKITPLKSSRSGTLYLKSDIEIRKRELKTNMNKEDIIQTRFNNDTSIIEEATNYFTIHYLCNHSDVKTRTIFEELELYIEVSVPFASQIDEISKLTGFSKESILSANNIVNEGLKKLHDSDYIVKVGQSAYPSLLEKTANAPRFLFMRGNVELLHYPTISIVGTRNPSEDGKKRAQTLASILGKHKIVVASGLAKGIDRAAHEGAILANKPTIGVIGTPLTKSYPKENSEIQEEISQKFLLISQFAPSTPVQKWNFPARNAVMSGISLATVIIEAGETSGALIQANHALKQGRLVFIPQSALNDSRLSWPKRYIHKSGAHSFSKIDELLGQLQQANLLRESEEVEQIQIGAQHVYRDK